MHNPTVGTFAESIVEPTDVRTMDIHIPMEDILHIPMEDIPLTPMEPMEDILHIPMEDIIVHPISGDGTNAIGTRQALEHSVPTAC
jgi:2-phospho-L-lactate guanylyltransferase (CobY/MobA/RfbA family)